MSPPYPFRPSWTIIRLLCTRLYSNKVVPVLAHQKMLDFGDKIAVVDINGKHSYQHIIRQSINLAEMIEKHYPKDDGKQQAEQRHVAFICPNHHSYVVTLIACWMSGSVAVPLSKTLPVQQLEYYIKDSSSSLLISTDEFSELASGLCTQLQVPHHVLKMVETPSSTEAKLRQELSKKVSKNLPALIIYTSGTTGPPKGVVLTHGNLNAQVEALVRAWHIQITDCVLHALPLHHMHGIVNALLTPLTTGGCVHMLPKFDAHKVWELFTSTDSEMPRINAFMGVPTMYSKLLEVYNAEFKGKIRVMEFIRTMCKEKIRLMVCGSDALPQTTFEQWEEVSGHRPLERYGMTEIGMALSNPLIAGNRKPGFVGTPLPKVKVCIAKPNIYSPKGYDVIALGDEHGTTVKEDVGKDSGELYIQGPSVFHEYWNKPQETTAAFTSDNWFKTGDVAQFVDGSYKILGRSSVDIIKSGGYKISALDVQRHLLTHEDIAECAVVGLPDITWGQKVAAVVVVKSKSNMTTEQLREWCKSRLPPYSVPSVVRFIDQLPRSPIGKVNKKKLIKDVFNEGRVY